MPMLGRLRMEPGGKRKLSVLPTPFCCEPKATLKSHRFLKEKKIITTTNVPWNCFFPKMVSVILPEGKEHVLNNFFNSIFLYQNHGTRASLTGLREGPGAGPPALDAPTREPFPRRLHPPHPREKHVSPQQGLESYTEWFSLNLLRLKPSRLWSVRGNSPYVGKTRGCAST